MESPAESNIGEASMSPEKGELARETRNEISMADRDERPTPVKRKTKDGTEVDTCRICRGEGSADEPLFYPCKCSGSIKYVHQNCLVEWLSHSQKKHCELCKTQFRFTKLYHPHMPSTVPIPIFVRQAALHAWKTILTWSRFQLVLFVWVLWLPWCTRNIWRGLFWIADGTWVNDAAKRDLRTGTSQMLNATLKSTESSVMSHNATASAFLGYFAGKVSKTLQMSQLHYQPASFRILKKAFDYVRGHNNSIPASTSQALPRHSTTTPRSATWLSEVTFLKKLTPSTMVNNIIIDTLEGQLITLFVVTGFILIFLIREWVMQQQQNLIIGPDGNIQEPEGPEIVDVRQDEPEFRAPEPAPEARGVNDGPDGEADEERNANRHHGPGGRIFARPRLRVNRPPQQGIHRPVESVQRRADDERGTGAIESRGPGLLRQDAENLVFAPDAYFSFEVPAFEEENESEVVRSQRVFNELVRDSFAFRRAWYQSDFNMSEALEIVMNENQYGEHDVLARMKRLRSSKEFQSHINMLRGNSIFRRSSYNIEHDIGGTLVARDSQTQKEEDMMNSNFTEDKSVDSGDSTLGRAESSSSVSRHDPLVSTIFNAGGLSEAHSTDEVDESLEDKDEMRGSWVTNEELRLLLSHEGGGSSSDRVPSVEDRLDDKQRVERTEDPPSSTPNDWSQDNTNEDITSVPAEEMPQDNEPAAAATNRDQSTTHIPDSGAENNLEDQTYMEKIKNWLWGGVNLPPGGLAEQANGDEEHIINDIAEEEPFVPLGRGQHLLDLPPNEENDERDPEVVAAAVQAGIDPNGADGVDEMEDLEGIMELIGMEGPLIGLVQNGMFFAVLVSITILFGMWTPYAFGKIFLIALDNPIAISLATLRLLSSFADMATDLTIFVTGCGLYWLDTLVNTTCTPVGWVLPSLKRYTDNTVVAKTSKAYAESALERLAKASAATSDSLAEPLDIPRVSALAHQSLLHLESQASKILQWIYHAIVEVYYSAINWPDTIRTLLTLTKETTTHVWGSLGSRSEEFLILARSESILARLNPLNIKLAAAQRIDVDYDLVMWNGTSRALAIIAGYVLFALVATVFLQIAASIKGTNKKGVVEGNFASVLYQAGGVLKVILIISIEMLLFPLYCGTLLDMALLPLFENATFMSRVEFTIESPWTSVFIHWFVGTCYMFHFALFVSMCRKIMRSGVLYFIRDPDDPTVHPVRDVLERNVSTQLWKISLSAFVCGGLVLASLAVVWGIGAASKGVFPIHWSSNEPVLEFPVDLLFYNFLMPISVKLFRPSKILRKVFGWWFRKCARALRLSNFLFDEKFDDEEGRHVRQSWRDVFRGEKGDVANPVIGEDRKVLAQDRNARAYFLRDGRYVRAPASDSVRLPVGVPTFLEVDANGNRVDGIPDKDEGIHGKKNTQFTKVYVPPHFRLRISAFLSLVWGFSAVTGILVTIIPLVFGRWVFSIITPERLRMNDVYAFSIGIYILGSLGYMIVTYDRILQHVRTKLAPHSNTVSSFYHKVLASSLQFSKLLYTYAAFGIILPFIFSLFLEFYVIVPLHTYLSQRGEGRKQPETFQGASIASTASPIIHLIQDWTLGVLYVKVFARLILWTNPSRPARALQAIVRNGWLDPDARLATRGFIFPAILLMTVVLTAPLALGWTANHTILHSWSKNNVTAQVQVYRYSYPAVLALCVIGVLVWALSKAFRGWRRKVRDEVYLIGERLHNLGDGKRKAKRSAEKGKQRAIE